MAYTTFGVLIAMEEERSAISRSIQPFAQSLNCCTVFIIKIGLRKKLDLALSIYGGHWWIDLTGGGRKEVPFRGGS